ncbi:hypothetical protein BJP34_28465 [Moorena producens PAL-8-15-08-1]|uniref:DUF4870 domain-containing protein n=1 Tax=Moorena producens PAL-8-15-08-1 TaxID=1458985 RepID=A0A1D8TYW5_9CYAN|nr:DUF4870 domain-containing protein [Moorena producens]AOX02850.1 hypothetical protein BJP34_28465 [Moorena producens PAL-8-15-08-1]
MNDIDQRKLLSVLCHGSIFLNFLVVPIAIPIVIFLLTEDSVVKENAKEALNFHICLYIYWVICLILAVVIIGIPLLFILGLVSLIMPIIALVKVLENPNQPYRYPYIFRVL